MCRCPVCLCAADVEHEVLQQIKEDRDLCTIPVVVLTSSTRSTDILSAYSHGANSYLQKPWDLDGVLDLVRTLEHYWLDLALLPVPSAQSRAALSRDPF